MSKFLLIALIMVSSQTVSANQGEVCTENKWNEHTTQALKGLNNNDIYNCPSLGNVTIPQIYQKGFRIVLHDALSKAENNGMVVFYKRTLLIEKIP